jgi:hypothetical protein
MPIRNRAAQFAPFAALTGYDDAVREAGRRTDCRPEPGEDAAEAINRALCRVRERVETQPEITVTWFIPDERKAGGAIRTVTDRVQAVKERPLRLVLRRGTEVPAAEILEICVADIG